MKNVKLLLYFSALVVAEATLNVCIRSESPEVLGASIDDVFQDIASDISKKLAPNADNPDLIDIGHVDVDISHPAIRLLGTLDEVKLYNLPDFRICFLENIYLNSSYYQFDPFNITFNNLRVEGVYNLTGDLADVFDVVGDGDFWVELHNLSLAVVNFTFNVGDDICFPVNLEIDLVEFRNQLDGLMHDDELGEIFNNVVSDIVPEALKILWEEWKVIFHDTLEDALNDIVNDILGHKNLAPVSNMLKSNQIENLKSGKYCFP